LPERRWLRIIPAALITYTIAYIDRVNISMALPSLSRGLHMNSVQAGNVAGIFFWGYLVLQIPGGLIAEHWSAKRFINMLLLAWGMAAVGCGLVQNWHELWVMRLLLGITQGGVFSATLVLISHWFPRDERARANALWMLCGPIAIVISSPLSGWILDHWNWRTMLVFEGLFPFVWFAGFNLLIYDHPRDARWISADERKYLEATLERQRAELQHVNSEVTLRAMFGSQLLLLSVIYFLRTSSEIGFLMWLPTALEDVRKLSNAAVGTLATLPFVVAIFAMLVNSWHSDKTGERRIHVALSFALGGAFLLIGVLVSSTWPILAFVFICLTSIGTYGPLGPFWAIPTETLSPNVAATMMGVITAIGSLGGFFGPVVLGYLKKLEGNFRFGFEVIGIALLLISGLSLRISLARASPNGSRAPSQRTHGTFHN
jgi:sugar phosphate permease